MMLYTAVKTIPETQKAETMTDPTMARLMLEGPKELKAVRVNGQIIVETDDDRERLHVAVADLLNSLRFDFES